MSKPKLLLGVGNPFSGVSSLLYTLSVDNAYCHGWNPTSKDYLSLVAGEIGGIELKPFEPDTLKKRKLFREIAKKRVSKFAWRMDNPSGNRPPEITTTNSLVNGDMDIATEKALMSTPFTVQKYIDYQLAHWEKIKDNFQSLVDFGSFVGFTEEALSVLIPKLQESFDVKANIIFRDPVRKYWSMMNSRRYTNRVFYEQTTGGVSTAYDDPYTSVSGQKKSLIDRELNEINNRAYGIEAKTVMEPENWFENFFTYRGNRNGGSHYAPINIRTKKTALTIDEDYAEIYTKFVNVLGAGNVHTTVMEQLFGGVTAAKDALSTFLGFDIVNLANCAYVPESGINATQHPYLQDQWSTDKVELTDELKAKGRQYLKTTYDNYAATFGSIPSEWTQA